MLYGLFFAAEVSSTWHQLRLLDVAGESEDEPVIMICKLNNDYQVDAPDAFLKLNT